VPLAHTIWDGSVHEATRTIDMEDATRHALENTQSALVGTFGFLKAVQNSRFTPSITVKCLALSAFKTNDL
jgi:hypothetical protein